MKKIISLLALVCLICCMFPVSVFASSDTEYIRNRIHTGIWYSNPATKEALDSCDVGFCLDEQIQPMVEYLYFDLKHLTLDIYDDLLLTGHNCQRAFKFYCFKNGTIRCNDCRAFNLYKDGIQLYLINLDIENGCAICPDDYDFGYGGAIYVDGAGCSIIDEHALVGEAGIRKQGDLVSVLYTQTHSVIENCYTSYGGAIAVCGHDCTINGLTFKSNTGINNGGNDLYVHWGDCHVNGCTFDKDQEGAAAYITADTYFTDCNITKDMCVGDLHQVFINNPTASLISEGNLWIIIAVVIVAAGVAFFVIKKKKAV